MVGKHVDPADPTRAAAAHDRLFAEALALEGRRYSEKAAMSRQEALDLMTARGPEIRRLFGVRRLALFGSMARGEARKDSDVDFEGPPDFDLKFFLEDLLGKRVDLVTRKGLEPRLRARVEGEAVDLT